MTGQIFNVLVIIVGGVMLADLVTHPQGTSTIINGLQGWWGTSVNGLLGKTS